MSYSAYVLDDASRAKLLEKFPPQNDRVVAHHITYEFPSDEEPPAPESAKVVGRVAEDGIEALVVMIDGEKFRPDGKIYHITWSLDPERFKPVDSNQLLKRHRYTIVRHIPITVTPSVLV